MFGIIVTIVNIFELATYFVELNVHYGGTNIYLEWYPV